MRSAWVLLLALSASGACAASAPGERTPSGTEAGVVRSNALRADYAGTAACGGCHAEIQQKFLASPMHRMTRLAEGAEIRAPFDGSVYRFKGDSVTTEEHGGRRYMRLASQREGARLYRITKVIGGHYREDFAGREVRGTEADSPEAGDAERVMPLSWLLSDRSWRSKGYSVMVTERPGLAAGVVWRETCIFCHNTTPHLVTAYDNLAPGGPKYQGSVSEGLLPAARTWAYRTTDPTALRAELGRELGLLGEEAPGGSIDETLRAAARATRRHFDQRHLVEVGIGCEACHNGSREHAADPRVKPSFEVRSSLFRVTPAAGMPTRAAQINRTCARCHTVLFSRYPFTWEGGERDAAVPGGSHINSGEGRDFLLGGCAGEMACSTCHDPHAGSSRARLEELGTPRGNAVCTSCHETLAAPEAVAKHAHHSPAGAGGACLSCHMPRKNMGLAHRVTRYHRIGSPTDTVRVEGDRPLECALCHADQSVASLVGTMERWWGKAYDRKKLSALYGSLDGNALVQTLELGKPHERVAAAAALGEHGSKDHAPALVRQLGDPYPLARRFAHEALTDLLERRLVLELDDEPARIIAEAHRQLASP
jgi:predicted CXXCH cytochrome family protein